MATDQQGNGTLYQYWWPCCGGDVHRLLPGQRRRPNLRPAAGEQWPADPRPAVAVHGRCQLRRQPGQRQGCVISSAVGRIFATTNAGVTWFDIGDPAVFGSPNSFSVALAYGAPDPNAPEGIGNLGNFIYVGTQTGQIYVTQDGGGSGDEQQLDQYLHGPRRCAVKSITTDPTRGSHDAYAVTNRRRLLHRRLDPLGDQSRPDVGQHHRQHPQPALLPSSARAITRRPTPTRRRTTWPTALTSIVADWRYAIPNNPSDPSAGLLTLCCTSAANSGVYMSIDDGKTWTLFPDTTFGAVVEGAICPTSTSPTSACRSATSTPIPACPTWPVRTTRPIRRPRRTPTSCWPRPSAKARSPSTWRRWCFPSNQTELDPAASRAPRPTAHRW